MQVTIEDDLSLLIKSSNQPLNSKVNGMKSLRCIFPATIQVLATQRASVISIDDAVWVQHWYNFEDEFLSEDSSLGSIAHQELDKTFHHP